MAYKGIRFIKWLTKKDIKTILEMNNMELCEGFPNAIFTHHKEDGESSIIVTARRKDNLSYYGEIASKYVLPIVTGMLMAANGQNAYNANNTLVEIDNFTMTEMNCAFLSEDEEYERDRELTKKYHVFMQKKFGDFYNDQKAQYIRQLKKEEKQQQQQESEEKEEKQQQESEEKEQ